MNPEFRRNLWLELNPRRIAFAVVFLSLVFFAAALSDKSGGYAATAAALLYYAIVVVWGTHNAVLGVVGEIRERTWDAQRLSSLSAGEMMWGKLFGSTIYNWFMGAICLAAVLVHTLVHDGPLGALIDLAYFASIGVIAQASSLLASLVAVRRRRTHSRSEIFLYQLAGLSAATAVYWVWSAADPASAAIGGRLYIAPIMWWGETFGARPFLLVSLALFAGWTLLGCYRQMRRELKIENGPLVWLAFLVFIGFYVAGFDAWLSREAMTAGWDTSALRLSLAASAFAALTYVMVLIEPKDRVHFRWLGAQLAHARVGSFLRRLDGFTMSYIALVLSACVLMGWLWSHVAGSQANIALIAAGLGFVTRDVAIFVFFGTHPGRRRGDFTAAIALFTLYLLVPSILSGLGLGRALLLFYPEIAAPLWLAPLFAWAEALAVAVPSFVRLVRGENPVAEAAPS